MIGRRAVLAGSLAAGAAAGISQRARSAPTLKIGNTMPYSGVASSYAPIGWTDAAFFKMVNEQGGVGGRQIEFISLDDSFSPPKTVECVRRLVEQDGVDFIFNTLGTAPNTAIEKYCNQRKVPQLFVSTGADKWGNYKEYPWTIGFQPSYRTEAQIYAKYFLKTKPDAKVAILYQNDDFGKDYLHGVRDILGENWDKYVVKVVSYEATDPTIDSQIVSLQASGADTLIAGASPKAAAQAIRKIHELGWHPLFFLSNVSLSVAAVIQPAGPENAVGIISGGWLKDPDDPAFRNDKGMNEWRAFMAKHMPNANTSDNNYVYGYTFSTVMVHVLRRCNGDFSRANVMKQATSIDPPLVVPTILPGITVSTSPTNYHPIRAMQLQRWDGKTWVRFGEVIEGVKL